MAANPLPVASSGKDQQILTAFVLRARRIAAHSLAQDIETLRSHATEWKMNVDSDGRVSMVRNLPDEERFESLAARIRPLTLKSEPIWYQTVIDAIQSVISDVGATIDADLTKELAALAELWRTWDTENLSMRGYHTELARITDPSEQQAETFSATDAQLGAGWFYADVAHADPKGEKAVALEYPIGSRFEAAVPVWSGLAVVVLRTLALLRELTNRGYLALAESAWTAPVTAESGEVERVSFSAYVAPVGTPVPPIGAARGPEWKELSVETVERLLGIFHLVARFVDEGGAELGVWPATTSRRTEAGKLAGLDLRLDDLLDFHLPMPDVAQADVRVDFLGRLRPIANFIASSPFSALCSTPAR